MGLFPGAKQFCKERSGAFIEPPVEHPELYVSDLMLLLYMFDATQRPPHINQLVDFIWTRIETPDKGRSVQREQIHVVTFDVHGHSPLAKVPMQRKRSSKMVSDSIDVVPLDEILAGISEGNLPTPLSPALRRNGVLPLVITKLVDGIRERYRSTRSMQGGLLVQSHLGAIMLTRGEFGATIEQKVETAGRHPQIIAEGDLSCCFWVNHFSRRSSMVISKDTDMLLLLALNAPSRGDIILRLDYNNVKDYISIRAFRQWLERSFGSLYDGFMYITLQGNDYVQKVTSKIGAAAHLDELATHTRQDQVNAVVQVDDTFAVDEELMLSRMREACVRGSLAKNASVLIRQAWWYLFYAIQQSNGKDHPVPLCVQASDSGASLFGWTVKPTGDVDHATVIEPVAPQFSVT